MARDIYVPFRFVLTDEAAGERFRGGPSQPQRVVLTPTEGQSTPSTGAPPDVDGAPSYGSFVAR